MKKKYQKQILRYGEWEHPAAPEGILRIDKEFAQQLVNNFTETPFVPVLRGHIENSEAETNPELTVSKNITNLFANDDGVYVEFLADTKDIDKYNDVSAAIEPSYENHETGKNLGAVLTHVALVLNPFIKKLEGFVPLAENYKYNIFLSEIKMADEKTDTILEEKAEEVVTESTEEVTKSEAGSTEEVVEESETVTEEETKELEEETAVEAEKSEDSKEIVETSEEIRTQLAEYEKMKIELAETKTKQRAADAELFYTELLTKGKALPAFKSELVALASIENSTINLAEGQVSLKDTLKAMFDKMPALVNLSEKGINVEQGKMTTGVALSETMKESIRKTYFSRNPKATEDEFNTYLMEKEEIYKKYDK